MDAPNSDGGLLLRSGGLKYVKIPSQSQWYAQFLPVGRTSDRQWSGGQHNGVLILILRVRIIPSPAEFAT